ncbi:hypothetical protein C8Q75DRAFT_129198 [Abortiporus biennis]|nr:hypothetical protein C8Q75DRAFT_129198 [Abortiporus biennis]
MFPSFWFTISCRLVDLPYHSLSIGFRVQSFRVLVLPIFCVGTSCHYAYPLLSFVLSPFHSNFSFTSSIRFSMIHSINYSFLCLPHMNVLKRMIRYRDGGYCVQQVVDTVSRWVQMIAKQRKRK